mmetsp:Transcript_235/g.977  ORF Transcript_235/g.977 Transcript_235/m.977 type:complete len:284 (-) Transcript_235:524-1375(-)
MISSASLLPMPNTRRSLPRLSESAAEKEKPLMPSSRYALKISARSLILASKSPPNKDTGPTPGKEPTALESLALYAKTESTLAQTLDMSRLEPRSLHNAMVSLTICATCAVASSWAISPAELSSKLSSCWYALASAIAVELTCSIAADSLSAVRKSWLALSFNAKSTCASDTRNTRFHGNKNRACSSPNVCVEMNTSFWNSLRDSKSVSLSVEPSSMRFLNKRRPASKCACAAEASSMPSVWRNCLNASGSQPCTGSMPCGTRDIKYTSYNSVISVEHVAPMF